MSAIGYAILFMLLGLIIGGGGVLFVLLQRQRTEMIGIARDLKQLEGSMGALLAGATGSDRRQGRLEQRLQELQRRVEDMEENQSTSRPYDEAIRLVRQGATAQRLVQELGLSPGEAELLIMLHGDGAEPKTVGRKKGDSRQ